MRILVPIDGSSNASNALKFIAGRTTLIGSNPTIELLNVQQPLPARACRLVGQDALTRYYEDEAEKVLSLHEDFFKKLGLRLVNRLSLAMPPNPLRRKLNASMQTLS